MRKILVGVILVIIAVASAGYYGALLWTQHQLTLQVETAFEALRANVGLATHGKIEIDLKRRQITIADIVLQSDRAATATIKIGEIVVAGIIQPSPERIATDRIDIADLEIVVSSSSPASPQMIHRAPKITILGFSGPMALPHTLNNPSVADALQLSFKYFAATAAASISIPTLAVTVASLPSAATESGLSGPIDYTSTDIELHDIRDGLVGAMSLAHVGVTGNAAAPDLGRFTGEIGGFSVIDFDANTLLAMLDPAKVKNDGYLRLYRRVSFGPYAIRFDKGTNVQMDSLTIDDVSLRPSKLSVAEFLPLADAGAPSSGSISPTQLRAMLDRIAGFCEGIRVGKVELRGISANMPPEFAFKLTAIRISGLENGRLAEFALEGLDSQTLQKEPLNVGRFALKGLNVANLVRTSAHLGDIGQRPKPEQFLGLLTHIEGIELNDIITSHGDKKQTARIDHFRLSWGHFVGQIPSTAHIAAKVSLPTSLASAFLTYLAADQDTLQILADTELKVAAVNLDFGVSWTETTRTFAVSPALVEFDDMFSASAKLSIHNVRRNIFTIDPDKIMSAVELLEAGPVELSLRDTGGLHLAIAQFAKSQGQSPEEARDQLVEDINEVADLLIFVNPEAVPVAQAIARFIATPKSTLTIKISPIERVNLMQAFETAGADPPAVLSQFKIEAKATR